MDKEEFLRLITLYTDSAYNFADVPDEENSIFIESYDKPKPKVDNAVIDLTHIKSTLIKDKLGEFNNFKVGGFIIKIIDKRELDLDLVIYEAANGKKFLSKVNINIDSRFNQSDWAVYFNSFKSGKCIPIHKLSEIIRWIQGIHKMSAFT